MRDHGIVADGRERLRKALEAEVLRERFPEFAKASFWKRAQMKREIRQEVNRRMKNLSSPDSLHFAQPLKFPGTTKS